MMNIRLYIPLVLLFAVFSLAATCKRTPKGPDAASVEKKLLEQYRNGEISRCTWKGEQVYQCSRNAPDAGSEIMNASGTKIGGCYYNTGAVDPVCDQLENCLVIYRVEKNIWGKPGVNEIEK